MEEGVVRAEKRKEKEYLRGGLPCGGQPMIYLGYGSENGCSARLRGLASGGMIGCINNHHPLSLLEPVLSLSLSPSSPFRSVKTSHRDRADVLFLASLPKRIKTIFSFHQ